MLSSLRVKKYHSSYHRDHTEVLQCVWFGSISRSEIHLFVVWSNVKQQWHNWDNCCMFIGYTEGDKAPLQMNPSVFLMWYMNMPLYIFWKPPWRLWIHSFISTHKTQAGYSWFETGSKWKRNYKDVRKESQALHGPGMSLSRLALAHSTPHLMSCFCSLMVTFTHAEPLNNTQHDDIFTLILTEPKLWYLRAPPVFMVRVWTVCSKGITMDHILHQQIFPPNIMWPYNNVFVLPF